MNTEQQAQTVVVLGASNKPERYAYQAINRLQHYGHRVIPVHPKLTEINNIPVKTSLAEIQEAIDTLTLYIGPQRSEAIVSDIIALNPKRVIFNPGTESVILEQALSEAGIEYIKDCTLIMLSSHQFS
jgi:predicted CoA-binding protein